MTNIWESSIMNHQYVRRGLARPGALAAIACVVAGALACTAQPAIPAATDVLSPTAAPTGHVLKTVRSGSAGVMGEAGQQLAQAQGYFAQEGVAVNFVKVDASTVFTTPLQARSTFRGWAWKLECSALYCAEWSSVSSRPRLVAS